MLLRLVPYLDLCYSLSVLANAALCIGDVCRTRMVAVLMCSGVSLLAAEGVAALAGTRAVPLLVEVMHQKDGAAQRNAGIALARLAKDRTFSWNWVA